MTAREIVALAAAQGPWHAEPDGRIRNTRGHCPVMAVLGHWMPQRGDDMTEVMRVIEAADLPRSKHRPLLVERLGVK